MQVVSSVMRKLSDPDNERLRRLSWRSRRGLLELDLLLPAFVEQCYPTLNLEQQEAYEQLLSCEDPDILNWLDGREQPADEALWDVVNRIRDWNARR